MSSLSVANDAVLLGERETDTETCQSAIVSKRRSLKVNAGKSNQPYLVEFTEFTESNSHMSNRRV